MQVFTAYHTDAGIEKETNQDSLCLRVAESSLGLIVMAVVCDGMGGLAKGELASASVIRAFSNWFDTELENQLKEGFNEDIANRWNKIIKEQNQRIGTYGKSERIDLGTTIAALLIIGTKFMLIGYVGDSRIYRIGNKLEQLTEDQTIVQLEVSKGKLTPEQAKTDSRRSVLLQCIGASKNVTPEFIKGKADVGEAFLLCSDGFRNEISDDEIFSALRPDELIDETDMKKKLVELVEKNKQRQEKDNITAMLLYLEG